jgi:hypothetical protein
VESKKLKVECGKLKGERGKGKGESYKVVRGKYRGKIIIYY